MLKQADSYLYGLQSVANAKVYLLLVDDQSQEGTLYSQKTSFLLITFFANRTWMGRALIGSYLTSKSKVENQNLIILPQDKRFLWWLYTSRDTLNERKVSLGLYLVGGHNKQK